jgi:GTP cyclohydrolase I
MEFDDVDEKDLSEGNIDNSAIENAITEVLNAVGEDPQREGLRVTPRRVARMYHELLGGYTIDS